MRDRNADRVRLGDEVDKKETKKKLVGFIPESKELYARFDLHGNRSWTDKKPDDFEDAVENEETEQYAVIVRKRESDAAPPRTEL